jgi:hypothetical protein
VELIRAGTLDATLGATLWALIEGRVPVIVAAEEGGAGKSTLLEALLDFVDPAVRVVELSGSGETFDWLPQASELGWSVDLGRGPPSYTWGAEARLAVRAASIGYGLAATIHADSLDEVFAALRRPPVGIDDDELSRLGLVLILRRLPGDHRRVVAAHYVRPAARDMHGHVQRLGPAVLATWDPTTDIFEHFGWGVTPELALRVGAHAGDFEVDVDRRRDLLQGLADAGVVGVDAVREALDAYRHHATHPHPTTGATN